MLRFGSSTVQFSLTIILAMLACSASAQNADLSNLVFDIRLPSDENRLTVPSVDRTEADDSRNRELVDAVSAYRQSIAMLENTDPYTTELIEQLSALGDTYRELGRHEEAIASYDNAIQITKVNDGIENLNQVPLIEKIILTHLMQDDIDGIDRNREYIHYLYRKNYGPADPEMVDATIRLADWHMAAYYRENYRPDDPGLRLSTGALQRTQRNIMDGGPEGASLFMQMIFNGTIKDVNALDVLDYRLLKLDDIFYRLQLDLYENENMPLNVMMQIARRISALSFIAKQEMDYERDNYMYNTIYNDTREEALRNSKRRFDDSYRKGRDALEFNIELLQRTEELIDPQILASAFVELADWHLVYGKAQPAGVAYRQAYEVLTDAGYTTENINRAMASDIPIMLPVAATHLYSRQSTGLPDDAELTPHGYLDVSFVIDRLGNAEDVEFTDTYGEETGRVGELLRIQLKSMKFRPVLRNGELLSPGRVRLRYYYSY